MIELLKFSVSKFWIFAGCFCFFATIAHIITTLISRFFRTIMVLSRGWPPSHLDADGDWPTIEGKD